MLAHERPLPLAAVDDELDGAPGDGDGAEGDEESGEVVEPLASVDERRSAEREHGEVGELARRRDASREFGIALTRISSENAATAPSSQGEGTLRRSQSCRTASTAGDEQRRVGRADRERRSADVDVQAREVGRPKQAEAERDEEDIERKFASPTAVSGVAAGLASGEPMIGRRGRCTRRSTCYAHCFPHRHLAA